MGDAVVLRGAEVLANEYCRKGTFFIRMFLESDNHEDFEYLAHVNDLDMEKDAYQVQLLAFGEGSVMERALQIRALCPRHRAA